MAKKKQKAKHPIVLRFQPMFPAQFARYALHEARRGRGSKHCDPARQVLNRYNLIGTGTWREDFERKLEAIKQENFAEETEALHALGRKKDWLVRADRGLIDPWKTSQNGPLREVIITAHKDWFDAKDQGSDDPSMMFTAAQTSRENQFADRAVEWLESRFGDAVITARLDCDETTPHIHAIIAVWDQTTSKRRGTQTLLAPTKHGLLANYEAAQDDIGAFFTDLGLRRGKKRALARRKAETAGEEKPAYRQHVPPHVWRQQEEDRLRKKKKRMRKRDKGLARKEDAFAEDAAAWEAEKAAQGQEVAKRENEVSAREDAVTSREVEIGCAEELLEDVINGADLAPPEDAGDTPLTGRLRKKLLRAFRSTRDAAQAAAQDEVDRQLAKAHTLATAAQNFREALIAAIPQGIRDAVLRRVQPEATTLQEAEDKAEDKKPGRSKQRPDTEIDGS